MKDCAIRDFPGHIGEEVTIKGWVSNRRSSGKVSFLIFRDGTGICQVIAERVVLEEDYPEIKKIPLESSLIVHGKVVEEKRPRPGFPSEQPPSLAAITKTNRDHASAGRACQTSEELFL